MRCKRFLAITMVLVLVLTTVVPAFASLGEKPHLVSRFEDHPWQDENQKASTIAAKQITVTLGSVVIVIKLPSWFDKRLGTAKTTTQTTTAANPSGKAR